MVEALLKEIAAHGDRAAVVPVSRTLRDYPNKKTRCIDAPCLFYVASMEYRLTC